MAAPFFVSAADLSPRRAETAATGFIKATFVTNP